MDMTSSKDLMEMAGGDMDLLTNIMSEAMNRLELRALKDCPLYQLRDTPDKPYCDLLCGGCRKKASRMDEFNQCAQCKSVKYCSKSCQKLDWKEGGKAPFCYRKHQQLCPIMKEANEEFNSSEDKGVGLRKYFKWSDQHHPKVGSFFENEYLIRLGLNKQSDTSFWSAPHPLLGSFENTHDSLTPANPFTTFLGEQKFRNGAMLLRSKFPPLSYGWVNLKDGEYPTTKSPKKKPGNPIKNWKEYMEFRELSPTSVAPLLLHNVLTVYQMLNELDIQCGEKLVYLLGAEIELNMIPLFGELAYLMPDIDLTLVMISPSVKKICEEAKDHPNSIITKSHAVGPNIVVYENNPAGFGRIRIALYPTEEYFHEARDLPRCQAVLGLNAGIEAYTSWHPTLLQLVKSDIPFVVSDHSAISIFGITNFVIPGLHSRDKEFRPIGLESKLNPFHSPVARDIGIMVLPNVNNGYLLIWRGQRGDPAESAQKYQSQYLKDMWGRYDLK